MGGVDILINNAGVESAVSACDLTAAEWDRICDTNLRDVFLCSQSACRIIRSQNGGVIVNTSSIHETVPRLGTAHYCASKAGVPVLPDLLPRRGRDTAFASSVSLLERWRQR
jgi:NAD(P)-dependent dehydrogenase (short-subunit alcohol dehydrogenase family)